MRHLVAVITAVLLAGCVRESAAPADLVAPPVDVPRTIKYGSLDGDAHAQVGLMVAQAADGTPLWRCSGTLMSSKVFLTAGHCTSGAAHVEIWFDADVESGIPGNGYPFTGDVGGTPVTHPQFNDATFFLMDVGVVVLNTPRPASSFAVLPGENQLDAMGTARGRQEQTFTTVGYGLQFINPVFVEEQRVRMTATPHLVQINTGATGSQTLLLSNNASSGGICFGDSGGPNFIGSGNVIGGLTSFLKNGNCAGTGGVFRLDRKVARDWVLQMVAANP